MQRLHSRTACGPSGATGRKRTARVTATTSTPDKKRRTRRVLGIVAAVFLGVMLGVGVYTVGYGQAPAYLSSDPKTCTNCHVMNKEYEAYLAGPHAGHATCDDCHLPHTGVVDKLLVQAQDGVRHGWKFSTGQYPVNITIRESSLKVVNDACLYCHGDLTAQMRSTAYARGGDQISCTRCHAGVGHEK